MQKLVSCICLTDGRPWYKQVVSGVYIFMALAIILPFAFLALLLPYALITEIGFGAVAIVLAKFIGLLFAEIAAFVLLALGWDWATDD